MPSELKNIHLWFPSIFQLKGGIEVYSSFLLDALQNIYPNTEYHVFLKHDKVANLNSNYTPKIKFHGTGNWHSSQRTIAFATQIVSWGIRQRPNLIISTHLNFIVAASLLKKIAGIPYWAVAHGIDAWNIQNPALKTALHQADKILAVSNYTRDRLIQEQNLDPNLVSLLPNTFDAHRWQIAPKPSYLLERYKLDVQQPVILTVARLAAGEQYKGYDKILQVLPQVMQFIPNVHYLIVGKGDDLPRIKQLISQLKLQDCVTLTGFIPDSELADHYNLCDLFAMPSQGEGFGIVYLESLACGKPTLAGNKDGSVDALDRGKLGVLVDPDDLKEIAWAIVGILNKTHSHPILYQPELLRQEVERKFGFAQFQRTVASHFSG